MPTSFLAQTRYTRGCPPALLRKVRGVCARPQRMSDMRRVLATIAEEFNPRAYIVSTTNNLHLSRRIGVREVVERRLISCGAMATVVASVFRALGLPTKLIHGRYVRQSPQMRHAWNEIYVPSMRRFVSFDITREGFQLDAYHRREGEYADWSELDMETA